ncbi:type II toxin-antitoxin system VapB family antitoxin [Brucella pseudogrignonensis]|jgi:antitoxin VapB|uniref:Antitoxin VapB n=1 Tax=Brucella pseudogrignonensis TaxID=419475 RepID=A0ABU1MBN5_9HYPH|nr:type II toxin-antitoxin system VapB family antitoxin [Brucella pseudogrignonensis]MDR6433453.1 antitoxin VapB [Brucella pseudogrignonensis]
MPLYIRDDEVDALAIKVMNMTKAPNKTEAVRRALMHELARSSKTVPLKDRVDQITLRIKARMGQNQTDFDPKKFADDMWGS